MGGAPMAGSHWRWAGILVFLPALILAPSVSASTGSAERGPHYVYIHPGDDFQAVVDAHEAGTIYVVKAGVHREQRVVPKDGDWFVGEDGAVMNGSRVIDGWVPTDGAWKHEIAVPFPGGLRNGACADEDEADRLPNALGETEGGVEASVRVGLACTYPEQLYDLNPVTGNFRVLERVPFSPASALEPGQWMLEYCNTCYQPEGRPLAQTVYVGEDLSGHVVELSTTPFAFGYDVDVDKGQGGEYEPGIGNFELVFPSEFGGIAHFYRDNEIVDADPPWYRTGSNDGLPFGTELGMVDGVTFIQSNYTTGANEGNLEVVARVGDTLHHFFRGDTATDLDWTYNGPIIVDGAVVDDAAGDPVLVQSSFGARGNFELVYPSEFGGIAHLYRDNNIVGADPPWYRTGSNDGLPFGTELGMVDGVTFIQSNYTAGADEGNLEVVARVGDTLHHFFRGDTAADLDWTYNGPVTVLYTELLDEAAADPVLVQSSFGARDPYREDDPYAYKARNVTIQNLVVEKYATPAHTGAIGYFRPGLDWIIEDNEVAWNHAVGISFRGRAQVRGNNVHHNGQMGIACGDGNTYPERGGELPEWGWDGGYCGDGGVVEGNTIASNNLSVVGFNRDWSTGGAKFSQSLNLQVLDNVVVDNYGRGFWSDFAYDGGLYAGNRIEDNYQDGIFIEITLGSTVVRDNYVRGNGWHRNEVGVREDGDDAQITISNSPNVEVFDNQVIANQGQAITILQRDGRNVEGLPVDSRANVIHDNTVVPCGPGDGTLGLTGGVHIDASNEFYDNTYIVGDPDGAYWWWSGTGPSETRTLNHAQWREVHPGEDEPLVQESCVSITGPPTVLELARGSRATFTVALDHPSSDWVRVPFTTVDGTATAGDDFWPASGNAYFAPGETSTWFTVSIRGDMVAEPSESFTVELFEPENAVLGRSRATTTILDSLPEVSISGPAAPVLEGANGLQPAVFTVSLDHPVSHWVRVPYRTTDATATAPEDYFARSGTALFAPGETSKTVTVSVRGDAVAEGTETFAVALFGATGAVVGRGTASAEILDDSPVVSIVGPGQVLETRSGVQAVVFTVSLDDPSSQRVRVPYRTVDGTAKAPADYYAKSGAAGFAPGETSKTVTVFVRGDTVPETTEAFTVQLSAPANAALGQGSAVTEIREGVRLPAGTDLQAAVDAHDPHTTFILGAGVHVATVTPKEGDTFIGETVGGGRATIMRGSVDLPLWNWIEEGDGQWRYGWYDAIPNPNPGHPRVGRCYPVEGAPVYCAPPEDVYVVDRNGAVVEVLAPKLYDPATSGPDLDDHSWFWRDEGAWNTTGQRRGHIVVGIDPDVLAARGHRLEISRFRQAFGTLCKAVVEGCQEGSDHVDGVTIRNMVVERYASWYQRAAIGGYISGENWLVEGTEVRYNHAAGIYVGGGSIVRSNYVHHNGHVGIKGSGDDVLVEDNTITENYLPQLLFSEDYESGGTKFSYTRRLVVRDNTVSDNVGVGLWTDIDNIEVLYEGNTVVNNLREGIFHEISFDAIIRNNVVEGNGEGHIVDGQLWHGAQIFIATSSGVHVCDNDVSSMAVAGNPDVEAKSRPESRGIVVLDNDRDVSGVTHTEPVGRGNVVHDNRITIGAGYTGISGIYSMRDPTRSYAWVGLSEADRQACLSGAADGGAYPSFEQAPWEGNLFTHNLYTNLNTPEGDHPLMWLVNGTGETALDATLVPWQGFLERGHESNG